MAGIKISELDQLLGANASDSDLLVIVDESAKKTKYITFGDLLASNIDSANKASTALIAGAAKKVFSKAGTSGDLFVMFKENQTGADSVQCDAGLTFDPSTGKLTTDIAGNADSATFAYTAGVADSANFNLTSLNDVTDNFGGLVAGQILKYDGNKWANANDEQGAAGSGVIASQINTVSTTTDASFLIPFVQAAGTDSVGVDAGITYNPSTDTLVVASLVGNASTADLALVATAATNARGVIADSVGAVGSFYPLLRGDHNSGGDSVDFTTNLSYEASTSTFSATYFNGDGSGVTNVAALSATNATNVQINQAGVDAIYYPHFGGSLSGNDGVEVQSKFRLNPGVHHISYLDSAAKFSLGLDSDFSIDAGGIQYSFKVTNNGSGDYTFSDRQNVFFPTSENDPVLYLRRGDTYRFDLTASGHPFEIRVSNGGSAYSTGVTNNSVEVGSVLFAVPMSAPSTLYYQCTSHSGMGNTINIV
jgi:hypothetical protein